MAEIFEKVSFDPYDFRITFSQEIRTDEKILGDKNMPISSEVVLNYVLVGCPCYTTVNFFAQFPFNSEFDLSSTFDLVVENN